jgi:dTDP-glucose 4,6-dehydratase
MDFAIHAANTASPREIADDPVGIARMVVEGSERVFAIAAAAGARRVLQLSSGSVTGAHYAPCAPLAEDDPGVPSGDTPAGMLALGKRDAERALLADAGKPGAPGVVFARGFALCGPWLPLDSDFAFGNFLGEAMRGAPVVVSGDGTPVRSYLYSSDMVVWLWTLLLRGMNGRAYNVGSGRPVTIRELAHRVAALLGGTVEVRRAPAPGARAHWHVADTSRARLELGLDEVMPLDDAIVRTAQWWGARGAPLRPSSGPQ